MLRFLRWIFGNDVAEVENRRVDEAKPVVHPSSRSRQNRVSDVYFDSMSRMRAAISNRDYQGAAALVHENLGVIPEWVKETRRDYGSFDIRSIPALEQGGTMLALLGDEEGLARMRRIVASSPELEPWTEEVERHRQDLRLCKSLEALVATRRNCLQSEVKELIGAEDGRRVANLLSYLDKAGKIRRVKAGRTYRILPSGSTDVPVPPPKRTIRSHRRRQALPKLLEIDPESLPYVPLPRAPARWEEAVVARERGVLKAAEHFEVRDAEWRIAKIEKIPPSERPDTAFRQMYPTGSGLVMVDDLGKADGLGPLPAAALRYDRLGRVAARKALQHGVYRVGVHPLGQGLIAMSRDCIVHAYDDDLEPVLETALADAPEVLALRKRFDIPDDQLKNHIRCVALSQGANRYLVTAVDEAWCVDTTGQACWGVKLPMKEGWSRIAAPSNEFGTSADVDQALALMDLSLPFTPETLKERYWDLAKRWHPDLNAGEPQAAEKMKALNAAAEVLTGIQASGLARAAGTTFVRESDRSEFEVSGARFTVSVGMQGGEINASDWIYAAGFAAHSDAAYLAGYSGRVILVDEQGMGTRAYDMGSVPRRIVDTGDYLYLLTDTRLYVLRDDALHALVDTFDGADVIVAQTAFGLLEKKRLRWFREDGQYLGAVLSRDPIRRVYSSNQGMVVETRQRRVLVEGVPTWWE